MKKTLYARCGSLQANDATLRTALLTLDERTDQDYSSNIKNRDAEYSNNKNIVTKLLEKFKFKYQKELNYDYYPGAFPDGCK